MAGPSDNNDWQPDDGTPEGLPDLPEEWGVIVIPDDLSELSDEVDAIRAELHLADRPGRWRRLLRRPGPRRLRKIASAVVRAPVLIVSMAVLVTVASLFASAWPGPPRQPVVQRSASDTERRGDALPALELIGADGRPVPLRGKLPAVILITDGCACDRLVAETSAAVRSDIAVVVITAATSAATSPVTNPPPAGPPPQTLGTAVRTLRDTATNVRNDLKVGPPDGTAAALLVDRYGQVVRRFSHAASIDQLRPDLATL